MLIYLLRVTWRSSPVGPRRAGTTFPLILNERIKEKYPSMNLVYPEIRGNLYTGKTRAGEKLVKNAIRRFNN